jgi:hypothetical protein
MGPFTRLRMEEITTRMFLLITENGPTGLSAIEVSLFVVATAINVIATCEFLWTSMIEVYAGKCLAPE